MSEIHIGDGTTVQQLSAELNEVETNLSALQRNLNDLEKKSTESDKKLKSRVDELATLEHTHEDELNKLRQTHAMVLNRFSSMLKPQRVETAKFRQDLLRLKAEVKSVTARRDKLRLKINHHESLDAAIALAADESSGVADMDFQAAVAGPSRCVTSTPIRNSSCSCRPYRYVVGVHKCLKLCGSAADSFIAVLCSHPETPYHYRFNQGILIRGLKRSSTDDQSDCDRCEPVINSICDPHYAVMMCGTKPPNAIYVNTCSGPDGLRTYELVLNEW